MRIERIEAIPVEVPPKKVFGANRYGVASRGARLNRDPVRPRASWIRNDRADSTLSLAGIRAVSCPPLQSHGAAASSDARPEDRAARTRCRHRV